LIVYGDRTRVRSPAALIEGLRADLARLDRAPPGVDRHANTVSLLIAAGELAQGIADEAFTRQGCDRLQAGTTAAMRLAVGLGRAMWRSHASRYAQATPLTSCRAALEALAREPLPDTVTVRPAEGFHHYAVYPEAYAAAAFAAFAARPLPVVIGVRTIGTTLAAAVAGALPAPGGPPLTVRPVGPPFQRRLVLGDDAAGWLAAARGRSVAVVDEGPGPTGTSFASVLDTLANAGFDERDLLIFPSHAGDAGGSARPEARVRWARLRRAHLPFEAVFLGPDDDRLASWTRDLIGPTDGPPDDLGAGAWRRLLFRDPRDWPPVMALRERRKLLLRARGERFLARFVGLGSAGAAASARAGELGEAGFSPPPLGLRHGLLVSRWIASARPLSSCRAWFPRSALLEHVAEYLAFRGGRFPADAVRGAAPEALLEMAVVNACEGIGPAAARRLERFAPLLPDLTRAARRIEVDARMHAWEWLVTDDGRLLKTDAVDHCDGHDPIGCQDIAWDLAGAIVELRLNPAEANALRRGLAERGHPIEPEPLAFYLSAYLAFQLGLHQSAAQAAADPAEQARLRNAADRYRRWLETERERPDGGGFRSEESVA
jgi:hypothetical protein